MVLVKYWNCSEIHIFFKSIHLVFLYIVGYLNEWIMECQQQGHKVFLGADSKFLDAIADPDLSPLFQDKWNLWMQCSASEKGNVSPSTGMRTDLNLQFDRPHPKSVLPDLTSGHFVLCIDHGLIYQSSGKSGNEGCQDKCWSRVKVSKFAIFCEMLKTK